MCVIKPLLASILFCFFTFPSIESMAHPTDDIVFKRKDKKSGVEISLEEGATYYLEVIRLVDNIVIYKVVNKLESPFKTIVLKFEHDIMYGTIFTIVNPFERQLDYCIRRKGEYAEYTDNIELPLATGTFQKGWPGEFISSIIISNIRLME